MTPDNPTILPARMTLLSDGKSIEKILDKLRGQDSKILTRVLASGEGKLTFIKDPNNNGWILIGTDHPK